MQHRQLRDHLAGVEYGTPKEAPPMNDQELLKRIILFPKDFQFDVDEVFIRKQGSDMVLLRLA